MIAPVPGQHAQAYDSELADNPCCGFNNEPCGKPSVHKIVGESDSFGSEYYYQCDPCREKQVAWDKANPTLSDCAWCKARNVQTRGIRDIDEGSHGPVYDVCGPCRQNYYDRLREETHALDDDDVDYDHQGDEEDDYVLVGAVEIDVFDEKNEPILVQQTLESLTTCEGRYQLAGENSGYYYWESLAEAKGWVEALPDDAEFIGVDGTIWKKSQLRFSCIEHAA